MLLAVMANDGVCLVAETGGVGRSVGCEREETGWAESREHGPDWNKQRLPQVSCFTDAMNSSLFYTVNIVSCEVVIITSTAKNDFRRHISQDADDRLESTFLIQRLSMIQRFIAVAIQGTFPMYTPTENDI